MKNFNLFNRMNPDGQPTVNRLSRLTSAQGQYSVGLTKFLTTLLLLLTLGVGQMGAAKGFFDSQADQNDEGLNPMTYRVYQSQIYEVGTQNVPSDYSNPSGNSNSYQPMTGPRKLGGGTDPGEQDKEYPVGEPWILLVFSLLFGGVIFLKARKTKALIEINHNTTDMKNNTTMKNNIANKTSLILLLLLTLGVGQMWATDLYVRGAHNDWGTGQKMTGTSTPWTNIAYWGSNAEFKISTSDWSSPNLGGNSNKLSLSWNTKSGALYNDGGSKNIQFPALPTGGGIVKLTVTLESSKYYIKAEKLVEENGSGDWYDITDPTIYFDNSAASYSNVSIVLGRVWAYGGQAQGYLAKTLSPITNTNLYYTQSIDNASGDASKYTTMLFANASMSGWTGGKQATEGVVDKTSFTNTHNSTLNSGKYLYKAASGNKGASLTKTNLSDYTDLNKTQTIQVRVSEDNGSSYTNAAFASWPGSITVARTYMSSATASRTPSAAAMTAATTTGVITSSITFTGANTTEYTFAGWSNSSTSPDGNTATTYTITDAATKYAFYKRKQYTLSYGVNSSTR